MAEPIILTDAELESVLRGSKPALILLTTGDGLRGEFLTAFKQAADQNPGIVFARIDTPSNPATAQRFDVGSKPVLVGWFGGEEVLRRNRPWGADVPLAVELLTAKIKETQPVDAQPVAMEKPVEKQPIANDKPVHVTDATFEAEVLNSDLPVLIDFWAEWCGPCRMVAPILDKLAKEFAGRVRIAKVNVDENPGLAQAFRVMSIPTIMLVKNRTIVFSQPGALPEPAFRDLLNQLIALQVPAKGAPQPTPQQ